MERRMSYEYAMVDKNTCECVQILGSAIEITEDPYYYVIPIKYNNEYLGKYYYNETWYERVWNEFDENGIPVESAGYTDVPWTPEGE